MRMSLTIIYSLLLLSISMWLQCDAYVYVPPGRYVFLPANTLSVLPFEYGGTTYYECTSAYSSHLWCAHDSQYRRGRWDYCTPPLSPHPRCVFPFTHQDRTYRRCTRTYNRMNGTYVIGKQYWCSFTAQYSGKWGYCRPPLAEPIPECTFPFSYKRRVYNACTDVDEATYWCPVKSVDRNLYRFNFDRWPVHFAYCSDKSWIPHPNCVMPFYHRGRKYNYCTVNWDNATRYWCADARHNGSRLYCTARPRDAHWKCVFPFTYLNRTYYDCTVVVYGKRWCSPTKVFERYWAACIKPKLLPHPRCRFPFYYKGTQYNTCTLVDARYGFWCAFTNYHNSSLVYGLCTDTTIQHHSACVFPFWYDGQLFDHCTHLYERNYWCSETYEWKRKWQFCDLPWIEPHERCASNFMYQGYRYKKCALKNHPSHWCTVLKDGFKGLRAQPLHWVHCNNTRVVPHPKCRKGVTFKYRERYYFFCTKHLYHRYWCQETVIRDWETRNWQNCTDYGQPYPDKPGTTPGYFKPIDRSLVRDHSYD